MSASPTQRTLDALRKGGCDLAQVVERWNPHARVRHDLFGIIDVLAIKDGDTIAVQSTSAGNVSSRVKKMEASEALPVLRKAGYTILVHGWRKAANGRWTCNVVDLS